MTNEMIILKNSLDLMRDGVIGTTGRTFKYVDKDGKEQEVQEPEPIHTYAGWKARGCQVKKGEHAVARFSIWKYTSRKDGETEEQAQEAGHCFMKMSHFFKQSQVEEGTDHA